MQHHAVCLLSLFIVQRMKKNQQPAIVNTRLPMFYFTIAAVMLVYFVPDLVIWLPNSIKGLG
jgi:C4-dicarboxylate transporter DctM subunit